MNVFAGNIVIAGDTTIEAIEFDYIESFSSNWEKVVYIFGETEMETSADLIAYFVSKIWEISVTDISISTEDAIGVVPYDYESWVYECARFEWENVWFEEVADRFEDVEWVFAIREAEVSTLFWNRVVKVDFIY